MLQRILPQLRTLLTSKVRGSTQHLWCRSRANDFLPVYWRSAHLTPKSTLLTSAGNFSCNKSSEMSTVGSPNSQGLSQQSCRTAVSPAPGEPLKPIRNYRGEASTSTNSLLPCIAAQDNSNLARKEAWSSLRHPKLPKRLSEQPGLCFSPHMTDKLHERTKPAPAQLQRNVCLRQRAERWSGYHVLPLNFCLSQQQSQITYRKLKAS